MAIRLAKECVFGADIIAMGKLSEEGLHFIGRLAKKQCVCV